MREQWAETVLGVVVLVLAAAFLVWSLSTGAIGGKPGGYVVTARFGQVGSLAPGAKVSVAGVRVGTVSAITLDPKTYLAVARLSLDPDVRLPTDSTAKITSDGLLGSGIVAIAPGGAPDNIRPGGEIENTQGSVDLFGLIGQMIRPPADASSSAAAPPAASAAGATAQ